MNDIFIIINSTIPHCPQCYHHFNDLPMKLTIYATLNNDSLPVLKACKHCLNATQ